MSDLWKLTAEETVDLIHQKQTSATEVTQDVLARLKDINPLINAVVTEMPEEALAAAADIDKKIAQGMEPGLLCGVPITTKVNVDQAGHATTNGLRLQRDLIAEVDSPVVANLRKAGAIIVGRTNTPAFSLRWFTRNSLHGHTLNPRNPRITPGGSSGGAAAAVASGIGAIGHGTDIGGSVRYPAYACGIHGVRPSLGRIPAMNFTGPDRHIGGQLMAVSGPLARSIGDLRLALRVMSAEDQRDPWWMPVTLDLPIRKKHAALCLTPDGLNTVQEVKQTLIQAAERLADAGWTIEEVECPSFREAARLQAVFWLAEFRRFGAKMIHEENDPDASMVYEQMEDLCPQSDLNGMLDAIQQRATLTRTWQLFLEQYPLLICPVSAELPFPDLLDVQSPQTFHRVLEAQLTQTGLPLMGLPGLTVSTGLIDDTPVGVQLIAGRYHENTLLVAGEIIEQGGTPPSPIDPMVF